MEGAHIVTGREVLFRISSFWVKIFSVAFVTRAKVWAARPVRRAWIAL
jgi:hypothetical protein